MGIAMHILITAGPTREYIDAVRFLSNASSGKMGYALAEAALARGHRVTLVSGPVAIHPPAGADVVRVVTTEEMLAACLAAFPNCDGLIAAAAVCDYRPKSSHPGKLKKTGRSLVLELVETPDVLARLCAVKDHRWTVGFALEAEDELANAAAKLRSKNCDAIVVNRPSAISSDRTELSVVDRNQAVAGQFQGSKSSVADQILAWIETNLVRN